MKKKINAITLCLNCGEEIKYNIKEEITMIEYRGYTIEYMETVAYCPNCGNPVDVLGLWDKNLHKIQEAYCKQTGRVTQNDILLLLKQYKIGKAPLAKMLHWGEATIKRYVAGFIPTKAYSDQIKALIESPLLFLSKLENARKNEDTQISLCAYRKAKFAAESIIGKKGNNLYCKNESSAIIYENLSQNSLVTEEPIGRDSRREFYFAA